MKVKTRFAPSPTGNLHLGSVRTALYSWLFARHYKGEFILRIEDTDFERSNPHSIKSILDGLKWLGLNWDHGPYFQSKRLLRYQEMIKIMLDNKHAYKCFCSMEVLEAERKKQILKGEKPRYNGKCRNLDNPSDFKKNYVIRFKNPCSGKVVFIDQIRGKIIFENKELDDLIIQRSNGFPTYNFCVVIDDLDMNITHVVRGEDHINNTPRQINIFNALNASAPTYAHVSMILDENGQKISKRKDAKNILEYRNIGILPEALLNYIVRLGWSYGDQEIFSISEMKALFNLKVITKSASIVNMQKLLWINKHYINNSSIDYITDILKNYIKKKNINIKNGPCLKSIVKLLKNRCHSFQEIAESCRYFYEEFELIPSETVNRYLISENISILQIINKKIHFMRSWSELDILELITTVSLELKITKKLVNMLIRIVVTGNVSSPNISTVVFLIGKDKTIFRIKKSINYIQNI